MSSQTQTTADKLKALIQKKQGAAPVLENLEKKPEKKKNPGWGGKREGGGRKTNEELYGTPPRMLMREMNEKHALEEIDVGETDPKTKKVVLKPRHQAMLEMLFTEGFRKRNIPAAKEWFDRVGGKAAQPIRGDADDDQPVRVNLEVTPLLNKVYGDDDSD